MRIGIGKEILHSPPRLDHQLFSIPGSQWQKVSSLQKLFCSLYKTGLVTPFPSQGHKKMTRHSSCLKINATSLGMEQKLLLCFYE